MINGFHKKQSLTTDGSTVTFSLDFTVASEESIIVVVGNVIQEIESAYNLAGGGTQITFTDPASTDSAYIIFLGQAIVQNLTNVGGAEFILDGDNDTSLTADTDDQIDIKIAGMMIFNLQQINLVYYQEVVNHLMIVQKVYFDNC